MHITLAESRGSERAHQIASSCFNVVVNLIKKQSYRLKRDDCARASSVCLAQIAQLSSNKKLMSHDAAAAAVAVITTSGLSL